MRNIARMSVRHGFRTRARVSNRYIWLELDIAMPRTPLCIAITVRNAMWVVDKEDVGKVFLGDKFFEFRWEMLVAWDRLIRNVKTRIVLDGFRAHAVRKSPFEVHSSCRIEGLHLFGCQSRILTSPASR